MAKLTLKEVSKQMRKIDICMMSTFAGTGIESRPMSNNKDVEYDGNSYFFTDGKSHVAKELAKNSRVNLAFTGKSHLYISVLGKAKLIKNREVMEAHWTKDLEIWFEDGLDTPAITMIHVQAQKIRYWEKMDEGEIKLDAKAAKKTKA